MSVDTSARWMPDAACLARADLPWTTDTERLPAAAVRAMTRVCDRCPVRNHCAAYAAEMAVTGGFWAGRDRDVLAPRRLSTAGVPVQPALPGLTGANVRGRVA